MSGERSTAESTSGGAAGLPSVPTDAREARRVTAVYLAVFAAIVVLFAGGLSLPFSSAECRFVHQGLRLLAMSEAPDLPADASDGEARALALLMSQTGVTERAVRLAILLGFLLAGFAVLETVRAKRVATAALCAAIFGGLPAFADADLVRPAFFAVAPIALMLLALRRAPLGAGIGTLIVAILGAAGAVRLEPRTGLLAAAVLLLGAVLSGRPGAIFRSLLVALGAALTARATFFPTPPAVLYVEPVKDVVFSLFGGVLPAGGVADPVFAAVAGGAALLLGVVFVRQERAPVLAAGTTMLVFLLASSRLMVDGAGLDAVRAAVAALPLFAVFAVRIAESGAAWFRPVLALLALCGAVLPFALKKDAAMRDDPRELLKALRAVSSAHDAAALSGEARIGAAVYSRIGHDPNMRLMFVPETADGDRLPVGARTLNAKLLWTNFDAAGIAGLSVPVEPAAASRPAGLRRYVVADR